MDKNTNKINQNQRIEAAKLTETCTLAGCVDDEDQNRLKCRKCGRLVHYECTQLPLYQLQIFVTSYNDQYLCHNCVRITRSLRSKIGENTFHMMQREIEMKDGVIKKLKNEISAKNRDSFKTDIETFLEGKITDLEMKTREIIKEEIRQTTEIVKESTQKTYAEITMKHEEDLKSVNEQKEEEKKEERDIESRNKKHHHSRDYGRLNGRHEGEDTQTGRK